MKILNEEKYAEEMIAKGFIQKKYEFELKILAKYFHFNGLSGEKLKEKIIEFCKSNIKKFNEIKYMAMIKRVCKYGENNKLFIVKPVRITKNEINQIKTLNDLKVEKVAFTLLVLSNINKQSYTEYIRAKIRNIIKNNENRKKPKEYKDLKLDFPKVNHTYYVNDKIGNIFKLAKVYLKKEERNSILRKLIENEFIVMTKSCKYKVNFVKHDVKTDAVIIKNFDDFVLEYERLIGDNIGYCECCEKPIRITVNNRKYCGKCHKEKQKEWQRESWHKNKDKYRPAKVAQIIL